MNDTKNKRKDFIKITKAINCDENLKIILTLVKDYIQKYGISDYLLDQLGKLFIHNNDYKMANKCLVLVNNKRGLTYYQLLIANFKLENYEEVINLYNVLLSNKDIYNQLTSRMQLICNHLFLYSEYKLGLNDNFDKLELIINFSKKKALHHINKHTRNIYNKSIHSTFNNEINIEELYDELTNEIYKSTKVYTDYLLTDCYYFGYYNVGICNNNQCDYLAVYTLPNSNNIVKMYPVTIDDIKDNYPINNIDEKCNKRLYKSRLSQIEKFNLKYNKK